ncbi:MAG: hypothetical protein EOO46_20715 [Flavobacterium sp.]|nr:MAG: hypothetical protein EOO46_20715 [Flavobacterium sp.]
MRKKLNSSMKKVNIFLALAVIIMIVNWILPDPRRFNFFTGDYDLLHITYMGKPIQNHENQSILKIDNLSSWFSIGKIYDDSPTNVMTGKYNFIEKNNVITLSISEANPKYLNGDYSITVDTIEFNKKFQNFRIVFQSKTTKIITLKSKTIIEL